MRKHRVPILSVAAVVMGLLLCLAIGAAWIVSSTQRPLVWSIPRGDHGGYRISAFGGDVHLLHCSPSTAPAGMVFGPAQITFQPATITTATQGRGAVVSGGSMRVVNKLGALRAAAGSFAGTQPSVPVPPPGTLTTILTPQPSTQLSTTSMTVVQVPSAPMSATASYQVTVNSTSNSSTGGTLTMSEYRVTQMTPQRHWSGINFEEGYIGGDTFRGSYRELHLPFGYPLGVTAMATILLALPLHARLRRIWRRRAGQCQQCGYDIRATPHRCPECGTLVGLSPDMTGTTVAVALTTTDQ